MKMNLCNDWSLRYEPLESSFNEANEIQCEANDWIDTDIPCDIREPLIRNNIVKEPLEGMNCYESEWIEEKSWWFKKTFDIVKETLNEDVVELVFESLDYGADIFLNGLHIGQQMSSFYPFRRNVKNMLKEGPNIILVRLTTGLERVNAEDMSRYVLMSEEERRPGRGDKRKAFLRKPQYTFGWDWSPKVSTCGIVKEVWLECHSKAIIRGVHTFVKNLKPEVELGIDIEIENLKRNSTQNADIKVKISLEGTEVASIDVDALLKSGLNYITLTVEMENAKLWWPNGMGEQPLYDIEVSADIEGKVTVFPLFKYGIRTVSIDNSKLSDGERLFAVVINGVRTFCKGANWIPCDAIYSRVTEERFDKLVSEAREANFNMLRIWGGGLYERDVFYEICDKYGIMIWHDFMFACSEYPDDQQWFIKEVEPEIEYQTKRLRNHPSIVLWCGNNENNWAFDEWWTDTTGYFGERVYNYIAPAAVRRNCPEIPYWTGSPYGGEHPNGPEMGDRHHWHDCMMNEDMQKRIVPEEYDRVTAKFVSEYGYVGPLKKSSILKYLDGAPFDISSDVWQHHNNTFEKDTVLAGIKYHYRDTDNLDMDDYLLYAGICQGTMYGYSLEAFRFKKECSGGLFWMYDDCWGETGWTIIDYYLTRKISYYFVKRALAPVKFIMRESNGYINVAGCNDGPAEKSLRIEYGYVSFDGKCRDTRQKDLILKPHSRNFVLDFSMGGYNVKTGVYFVKVLEESGIPTAILRTNPYRELEVPLTGLQVTAAERVGRDAVITVICSNFAHAVHFKLPDHIRLSDEYFDMLPGESCKVTIQDVPETLDIKAIKVYAVNF